MLHLSFVLIRPNPILKGLISKGVIQRLEAKEGQMVDPWYQRHVMRKKERNFGYFFIVENDESRRLIIMTCGIIVGLVITADIAQKCNNSKNIIWHI